MGRGLGHVTYFEFWNPPIIYGKAEAIQFKFCRRIQDKGY